MKNHRTCKHLNDYKKKRGKNLFQRQTKKKQNSNFNHLPTSDINQIKNHV